MVFKKYKITITELSNYNFNYVNTSYLLTCIYISLFIYSNEIGILHDPLTNIRVINYIM